MYSKFLKKVLATQGWYCIFGVKNKKGPRQILVKTLEEANAVVEELVSDHYDVYFGCATFKSNLNRQAPNAGHLKSFFLDLDCGPEKVLAKPNEAYDTQEEALAELVRFCEETSLPMPTLVNSGYGIHCYWILKEELERDEWKPIAERFKALCREHGMRIDPSVPADAARVLRVPGTLNFKKPDDPVAVEVFSSSARIDIEDFKSALGEIPVIASVPDYIQRGISPLQQKLMQNRSNSFQKILERSIGDNGCLQILDIAAEQATADYNLWRAGLSIARNCTDWNVAIHAISSEHPNYDYDLTEKKAEDLVDKPYLCKTFEDLRPSHCADCKFKGKIKSPISLGSEVLRAESDTIEYVKEEDPKEESEEQEEAQEETEQEAEREVVTYKVPQYPYPFFRGKNGGVYRRTEDEDDKLVYENDLYIVKRMDDHERGELALARVHLPKDKPKEFTIPLTSINSKDELRKILAAHGVVFMPTFVDGVMSYLIESVKMHQIKTDAEILRQQMGWVQGENKFVLGTYEYSEYGARYSPPSAKTESIVPTLVKKGSLEAWKEVADIYNRKGFEPHAFAFFTAFGSVLMPFTNYKGAFINLINKESGTGKTTILHMINSVWGHPQDLLSKESDTVAHKLFRLGLLNSLPFTADELSNMAPEKVSELLYSISQGKGAGRMQSQANMERKNDTTWSTIGVGSSNSSMVEALSMYKSAANGEIMRLLEYQINRTDILGKEEAHQLFDMTLCENYGHAGPVYIQWILKNRDYVGELISDVQKHIDERANFTNRDRYWSAVIACNIAGAIIAQHLELIAIDPMLILEWVVKELVPELKGVAKDTNVEDTEILGQFINENLSSALIVNDNPDQRTNLPTAPIQEPKNGMLLIRAELDTNLLWVASKAFKEFCVRHGIIYKAVLKALQKKGVFLGESKKRLGKGTKLVASHPVSAYKFVYASEDIIKDVENANSHD